MPFMTHRSAFTVITDFNDAKVVLVEGQGSGFGFRSLVWVDKKYLTNFFPLTMTITKLATLTFD